MKSRWRLLSLIVFCVFAASLVVLADSQTYTPPAEKGDIYVSLSRRDVQAYLDR